MSGHHYIEDAALLRAVLPAVPKDGRPAVRAAVERFLARQRTAPAMVGATAAAEIMGIQVPHVTRLREQGRMPEAISVEGSVDVYVRDEVEVLGAELRAERAARAQRKAEREGAKA